MKNTYLGLAILGAIVPFLFFVPFISAEGLNLAAFARGMFANGAAGGMSADLLLSSFIFWLFMFGRKQAGGPAPGLFITLNLIIGLSCALPAYLYAAADESVSNSEA